jgi:hypothetical protein
MAIKFGLCAHWVYVSKHVGVLIGDKTNYWAAETDQ